MADTRTGPPQPASRRSIDETRAALIDAGCAIVSDPGFAWGFAAVSFADAIRRSGVARASAYRAFNHHAYDPQESFRCEVLLELIRRTDVDREAVLGAIVSVDGAIYGQSPEGKAAHFREIIRVGALAMRESNVSNHLLRAVEATRAGASVGGPPDESMVDAFRESLRRSRGAFVPVYRELMRAFGLRLRPGLSLDDVANIIVSLAATSVRDWSTQPETREFERPTGFRGEDTVWSINGVLLEGLILVAFEPDPDSESSADLTSWLR